MSAAAEWYVVHWADTDLSTGTVFESYDNAASVAKKWIEQKKADKQDYSGIKITKWTSTDSDPIPAEVYRIGEDK